MIKALLRLAWPLTLSGLVTVVISGNDTVFLGRIGAGAVAAGATAVGVYAVATALLNGFALPAQVLTARHRGAGAPVEAARSAEHTASLAFWGSVPLVIVLMLLAEPLIHLIAGSAVDVTTAAAYLRILAGGLPLFAVGVVLGGFATGVGRSRVVLVGTLCSAAIDIGGTSLLFTFGGGTLGVAVGTLAGSVAPAVVALAWLRSLKREGIAVPAVREMLRRPDFRHEAWALGWPGALLGATGVGSSVVVTVLLAPSGTVVLATVRALDVVERPVWTLIYSLATAGTTLLAVRVGAGDREGHDRVVRTLAAAAAVIAVCCVVSLPPVTPAMLRVVVEDPQVAAAAGPIVWIYWAQVLWMAATATTNAVLRAHGDTRTPLRASLIGEYAVFLPVGWLLCRWLGLGLSGVYVAHHVFWAAFLVVGLIAARRRVAGGLPHRSLDEHESSPSGKGTE
ncbi:MATE family efflux transporter [Amycolatopsis sp. MtRt-6]|uniref:MATE family efflux transporter n=1 Tax=Amycolatopsis sp. MtRt-6 TaxID=2792782 RepID=UPI0027DD82AB|nr:MATE family efflux transporter [Amycolatopsis sp. MtRt-6]